MLDPIAPSPPILATTRAPSPLPFDRPRPEAGAQADRGTLSPPTPEPLQVDVAEAHDGVFVYTLKDPGTGAVLAVIPRRQVQGLKVDRRV